MFFVHWQHTSSCSVSISLCKLPFQSRPGGGTLDFLIQLGRLFSPHTHSYVAWGKKKIFVSSPFSWTLETHGAEITCFLKVRQSLSTLLTHPYMVIPFICMSKFREHVYANRHKHWDKGGRGVCRARSVVAWIQVFTILLACLKTAEQVQMWCRLSKRNTLLNWNQSLRIKKKKAEQSWTPTKRYVCYCVINFQIQWSVTLTKPNDYLWFHGVTLTSSSSPLWAWAVPQLL